MRKPTKQKNHLNDEDTYYKSLVNKTKADLANVLVANKNNSKLLPEYLQTLLEGTGVSIPKNTYPFTKPEWLDEDKVRRGQKFASGHIFGLMFATGMSVVLGFAWKSILEPLIYTGNSSTPFTAFKRYLLTITYVKKWYEGDMWQAGTESHKIMKIVRGMHDRVNKRLTDTPHEEFQKKTTLEGSGSPMWTELHEELLEDFKSCPPLLTPIAGPDQTHVNQTDMALTQFGFLGLVLIFPRMFGVHNATRDELDSFAHLWRAIGYLLGIEDRFNLCSGDLETVQRRVHDVLDYWLKPLMRYVSQDWIHMARSLTEGLSYLAPASSFEVSLLYLCEVLNVDTPRLVASLSFKQKLIHKYNLFFYKYLIRIPGVWNLFNWLFGKKLKEGAELSKEDLKKLEDRVYPYQSGGKCPMMC